MPYHYPSPEQPSTPESPWAGLSDEARDSLTRTTLGNSAASRLLSPETNFTTLHEITPEFKNVASEAIRQLENLLEAGGKTKSVPEINSPEFAHIKWKALEEGFRVMDDAGMEPELVIAPAGRVNGYWVNLFSSLRAWQFKNEPEAVNKLKNQNSTDGLKVTAGTLLRWHKLTHSSVAWSVSVIPTVSEAPFIELDYGGKVEEGVMAANLAEFLTKIPPPETSDNGFNHPSVESYLTLQALHILNGKTMLDCANAAVWYSSWLEGVFTLHDGVKVAPRGSWDIATGQLCLGWRNIIHDGGEDVGTRPEVRG